MQSTSLSNGNMTLRALTAGAKGPPLVFLHGFPDIALTFKDQIDRFAAAWTTVGLTLPGYMGSTRSSIVDDYRIDRVAEQIDGVLAKNFVDGVDLVAHDFGGLAAWFIAARGNTKLRSLTIVNAPHPAVYQAALMNDPVQQAVYKYVEVFSSPAGEKVCSRDDFAAIKRFLFDDVVKDEAEKAAYVASWSDPGALTAGLNYYRANGSFLRDGSHDDVVASCPTLVYWGLKDHALSQFNVKDLKRFAPRLTLELRKDLGHWSFRQAGNDFNAVLAKHLAEARQ